MPSWTPIAEWVAGGAMVLVILVDIFKTIFVPGPGGGRFRMILAVRSVSLPLWRHLAERRRGLDRRPSNGFAPMTLGLTFSAWMAVLLVGFSLMMLASADLFRPHLAGIGDALWVAGCSLLTLGVSEFDADGIARWLILACALSGFSALTASVTFMLQIQSGLHQREPAVMALVGVAGSPPSGVRILQTFATLDDRSHVGNFFAEWRDWAAATLHNHLSYPVLSYYRSVDAQNDWLAALEAVLDAATLVMAATNESASGAATLMHRSGARTATQLRELFGMEPLAVTCSAEEAAQAVEMIAAAGYRLRSGDDATERFLSMRADYAGDLEALARHLGANRSVLLPVPERENHAGGQRGEWGLNQPSKPDA